MNTVNTILDAKGLAENPKGFIAEKLKAAVIQGVFDHVAKPLHTARQKFETKCPGVGTLHTDPLDTGVSLEGYKQNYAKALAGLRVPAKQRAIILLLFLFDLNENSPKELVAERLALANQQLAKLPGMARYVKAFNDATDRYNFALAAVTNQVNLRDDELANYAGAAADLRIRAQALEAAAKVLRDAAEQLWHSPLIVWVPVLGAAQDLDTLAEGFGGLGKQLREFADTIDRRKVEYDRELRRLDDEGNRMAAQALSAYIGTPH